MMLQNKTRNVTNCQLAAPSVWAWLASQQAQPQPPPRSGMRAVSTKRESTGTGVFCLVKPEPRLSHLKNIVSRFESIHFVF
ncbi:hypothetical protein Hanom_Chr17g01533761 [Helianthus anomalus]